MDLSKLLGSETSSNKFQFGHGINYHKDGKAWKASIHPDKICLRNLLLGLASNTYHEVVIIVESCRVYSILPNKMCREKPNSQIYSLKMYLWERRFLFEIILCRLCTSVFWIICTNTLLDRMYTQTVFHLFS